MQNTSITLWNTYMFTLCMNKYGEGKHLKAGAEWSRMVKELEKECAISDGKSLDEKGRAVCGKFGYELPKSDQP